MAVRQEVAPQLSLEQRRVDLINHVRDRIADYSSTKVSFYKGRPEILEYSHSYNHPTLGEITIDTWPDYLVIERRKWNGSMTEITHIIISEELDLFTESGKANLEREEAIKETEKRIHQFIPPPAPPKLYSSI